MEFYATRPSLSLAAAIIHRARTRSNLRLTLDVTAGLLVAAGAAFWRQAGWAVIASAALCLMTFGAWGLADRALDQPSGFSRRPAVAASLLVLRTVSVTIGVAAALFFVFGVAGMAMGTWIS